MTELVARMPIAQRPSWLGAAARWGATLLGCGVLGVGFALAFNGINVSLALVLAGGLTGVGFLLLTVRRYETAIAIALLLMGIVRFEPAPTDVAFAVIMTVAALTGRFRLRAVPTVPRWIIGLLLIVNLISLMDVVSMSAALRFLFITAYLLIFSLWMTQYVDSPRRARKVVVIWLWVAVVSAVVSVAALNLPVPGRSFILGSVDGGERASGFFKDPNVFGPFLVPIAVILLEHRVTRRPTQLFRMRGITSWVLLLILSLGIVFAYSRAAWANYAIALFVMLAAASLRKAGARRALRALAVLLVTAGVAGVVLSAAGAIGFLEHRAKLQSYDTQRFDAQSAGWELGWTHPVGVGPGQFHYHYPVESHSTFVRTFSEQGFLGLLLWIAVLLVTLVLALRNVALGRDTYGIGSAALLGAWCGLIFNSVVVDTLHWRHLWLVAALIWASSTRKSSSEERPALAAQRQPASGRSADAQPVPA